VLQMRTANRTYFR